MLFNSLEFLFLPISLAGFFLLGRWRRDIGARWLAIASLFFYGSWNLIYLWLLLIFIVLNYYIRTEDCAGDAPWTRLARIRSHGEFSGAFASLVLFPLWGFSGYNTVTIAVVPPSGDNETLMH